MDLVSRADTPQYERERDDDGTRGEKLQAVLRFHGAVVATSKLDGEPVGKSPCEHEAEGDSYQARDIGCANNSGRKIAGRCCEDDGRGCIEDVEPDEPYAKSA